MATYADKVAALGGLIKVNIALAASATTDGMDITVSVKDHRGLAVTERKLLHLFMSENATGGGLTADAYSGDLTATAGAILTALTAKKHWAVVTDATGVFAATLVDTANPADQYVVIGGPDISGVVLSPISGTNWEGV